MNSVTVMIVGAAEEHCLGIRIAHDLGLHVFATDGNPESPGFLIADDYAVASTYDYDETYKVAKEYLSKGNSINGVMTLASDVPYTVAYIAEKLKLPGIGISAAERASEKIIMKNCFKQSGIPIPLFSEVYSVANTVEVSEKIGYPIIIKPVDSRGARGVQLLKSDKDVPQAYKLAHQYSPSNRVMIEKFLDGPQLSTEGFMLNNKAYIPAIFDRNYEYFNTYSPFIVENGGEMPSIFSKKYRNEIVEIMEKCGKALGIRNGVIKGDLVIHDGKVKVIEIAARLSGGFFGTVATPVSCGVNLVGINIRLALGEEIDPEELDHKNSRAAAIRFAFPEPGTIKKISGFDEVIKDSHCAYAHIFVKEGDKISPITNHPTRPAVVVADGNDIHEAINHSKRLINSINWEIDIDSE